MGNLKKTINSGSNRVVRMTISKMYGTTVKFLFKIAEGEGINCILQQGMEMCRWQRF